jgi:hydroxymethylbilane synthase
LTVSSPQSSMPTRKERDPSVILIATRASELAQRQARLVADALTLQGIISELVTFKTTGDKKLDQPLTEIGAKGLFTRELENALQKKKVDCCVHSLKDLPTEMPEGLEIVAQLEREDPRDAVVVNKRIEAEGLDDLPPGSRVGTSSLRRRAQLLSLRSDLEVVELRGNVPTRLKKIDGGQVHAAILAAAGLIRLDARNRIQTSLDAPGWRPAPGQGAIAIQIRSDDDRMRAMLAPLDHPPTSTATRAERAFLAVLEG